MVLAAVPEDGTHARDDTADASLQEISKGKDKELQLEVVAACLSVFTRLDSLL